MAYNNLTIPELRAAAEERGLIGLSEARTKEELIRLLTDNDNREVPRSPSRRSRETESQLFDSPSPSYNSWDSNPESEIPAASAASGSSGSSDVSGSEVAFVDPSYRLNFSPLVSRDMEVFPVDPNPTEFENLPVVSKFNYLRGAAIFINRYSPFHMITGEMVDSGTNIYPINPTENYIPSEAPPVEFYYGQETNYEDLANYLGLLGVEPALQKGHIIELLWWLSYGEFEHHISGIIRRVQDAAAMKNSELERTLLANNYNGPIDRSAMILAYATEKVVQSRSAHEYRRYSDLILNKFSTSVFGTFFEMCHAYDIGITQDGTRIAEANMLGPYRAIAAAFEEGPRGDLEIGIRLTPDNAQEMIDNYGLELYQDIITEDVDSYSQIFNMVYAYQLDGIFGRKGPVNITDGTPTHQQLAMMKNSEIVDTFKVDLAKLYYKNLLTLRESLKQEAIRIRSIPAPKPYWKMYNSSCDNGQGFSFDYGVGADVICFNASFIDAETPDPESTEYPVIRTGLKTTESFEDGTIVDQHLSFDQVIDLADYIKDIDLLGTEGTEGTEGVEGKVEGYESRIIAIADKYKSQQLRQQRVRDAFNDLSPEAKIVILNTYLWAIHAGTTSFEENREYYEGLKEIAQTVLTGNDAARYMARTDYYTKVIHSLVFMDEQAGVLIPDRPSNPATLLDDLVDFGDGYLRILNYPTSTIETMLDRWRQSL